MDHNLFQRLTIKYFDAQGWKVSPAILPQVKKAIILAAPHTSNTDFFLTMAALSKMEMPVRFTVKQEWLKFPFKKLMIGLGALGIDRIQGEKSQRVSHTDAMIDLFNQHEHLHLIITPEGTRSVQPKWRTGFFHVAKAAGLPIYLGFCDYKTKIAGIGKMIEATTLEETMCEVAKFYEGIHPKYPQKFVTDKTYCP